MAARISKKIAAALDASVMKAFLNWSSAVDGLRYLISDHHDGITDKMMTAYSF
jgi:hypothetical protein